MATPRSGFSSMRLTRTTDGVPFLPTVRYRNSLLAAAAAAVDWPPRPSNAARAAGSIISFRSGARAVYYFEIRKRESFLLFHDRRTECELDQFRRFVISITLFAHRYDRNLTNSSRRRSSIVARTRSNDNGVEPPE